MDGLGAFHSKSEKDKYVITYMYNLTNDTNKLIYKTETDSQSVENELMVARWGRIVGKGKLRSVGWTCTHCYI